jgi:uncharacterized metal-binding protein YceD (DUF177 family)
MSSPFIIPVHGLKNGAHHYDLEVEESFFEAYAESEIQKGSGKVELDIQKSERMLQLDFYLKGAVEIPCDRCGDLFDQLLELRKKVYMKFGNETMEKGDELEILGPETHEVDVSRHIYEFFHLALPIKRVHEEGACDPASLDKLKEHRDQGASSGSGDGIDPRWEKLKELKDR